MNASGVTLSNLSPTASSGCFIPVNPSSQSSRSSSTSSSSIPVNSSPTSISPESSPSIQQAISMAGFELIPMFLALIVLILKLGRKRV